MPHVILTVTLVGTAQIEPPQPWEVLVQKLDVDFAPYPGIRMVFHEVPATGDSGEHQRRLLNDAENVRGAAAELESGRITVDSVFYSVKGGYFVLDKTVLFDSRWEFDVIRDLLTFVYGFESATNPGWFPDW